MSSKTSVIVMLVLVIIATIALGASMRDQTWRTRKQDSDQKNHKYEEVEGLWAHCTVEDGDSKNWKTTCQSSTINLGKTSKTILQCVQVMTSIASITLMTSLVLTIIFTCKINCPMHKVHVANSVLLAITTLLLLASVIMYVVYFNKEQAPSKGGKLTNMNFYNYGGGFVSAVIALCISFVLMILCIVTGRKAKGVGNAAVPDSAITHPATMQKLAENKTESPNKTPKVTTEKVNLMSPPPSQKSPERRGSLPPVPKKRNPSKARTKSSFRSPSFPIMTVG